MVKKYLKQMIVGMNLSALVFLSISCSIPGKHEVFFGSTNPPERNILRYITGSEPESLDPHIGIGQSEARIYMALYEGLVEYDPKTLEPIPALAERWDVNNDYSEFVFHLRKTARWSNGEAITAQDFLYSIRRALSPELASRNAYFAYYIRYAQAYNEGAVFVRDPQTGQFLLAKDFAEISPELSSSLESSRKKSLTLVDSKHTTIDEGSKSDTLFHQDLQSPARLTLPVDEKSRNKLLTKNPKLQEAMADKDLVRVTADDIGVEAVDDYTVRISLAQSTPFFCGLVAHQFFRLVPRKGIEAYGNHWTDPTHIVTCGPFKVKSWTPYSELIVARDPMYWDVAKVHLEEIQFYPLADKSSIMNLYKAGEVDAVFNHAIPSAWLDFMRLKKDYMDHAEAAIDFTLINITKPPMNDPRVRKAFNMAIDKDAFARWKNVKPLTAFTPDGIFPGYSRPTGDPFDPARARELLVEAGYAVTQDGEGGYECLDFPVDQVEYLYNEPDLNKSTAEFLQAQWKQNLGITVPLRSMETRTFYSAVARLQYKGFSRYGYAADYMDPVTFLSLFYTPGGNNASGWWDPEYAAMLDEANRTPDKEKRYEMLAKAEKYLLDAQPIIPLDTPAVNWVKKPYVKGMYPNVGSLFPWKYVYIERDPAKWDYGTPSVH